MAFALLAPQTPAQAIRFLAAHPRDSVVLAGGTDLLLDLDEGLVEPTHVVSLRNLPWREIRWKGPTLEIGATAPLSDLLTDDRLKTDLPGFWKAVRSVGSPALRHRATVGGNLGRASPASDLIPPLLTLEAVVNMIGPNGRRSLPLDRLVSASRRTTLRPAELIESVTIPEVLPCEYLWQRVRLANDVSQVGIAVAQSPIPPHWRIALGGVPPRSIRLPSAEALLPSAEPRPIELELAAQEASRIAPFVSDKRATESYRRRLVYVLVRRALEAVRSQTSAAPRAQRPRPNPRRETSRPKSGSRRP